ncbi:MAG: bifunctional nuclease family protein [Deltaproteobacteria bacterium]|nr:bifunctional nuclease family protein [Deltaproteobacteria bacterium]
MYKAIVENIRIDKAINLPVIFLKVIEKDKVIPIHVGMLEASAVVSAMQKIKFDRPMTHDLFKNVLKELNVSVAKAELTDIRDNTYYAKIWLMLKDKVLDIDARPSDAIAIALRFNAPIFVNKKVMEKSNLKGKYQIMDRSEQGKKLAKYLRDLPADKFWKV